MKSVQSFKTRESAVQSAQRLKDKGIVAHVMVDPLESSMPALSDSAGVVLMVAEQDEHAARGILGGSTAGRRAS